MKAHNLSVSEAFKLLEADAHGLSGPEVSKRQESFGSNSFPIGKEANIFIMFAKQFLNPLIYVLLAATVISLFLGHMTDAGFIFFALILNALIGSIQEFKAEKSAKSLQTIISSKALVERDGNLYEIDAKELVPGDIVILQSGDKVPADIRLTENHSLIINESLLTGESLAVEKNSDVVVDVDTTVGDRINMAFSGTLVTSGRGRGLVTSIGLLTELGKIAKDLEEAVSKAPLMIRMEDLTRKISYFIVLASSVMGVIYYLQGNPFIEVLLLTVAIAVASIPEGLPVAITIALSIASKRMSKRNVIVKNLPAVEALGSCNYIATDKTGTLTVNELTVKKISFMEEEGWEVTGTGINPEGEVLIPAGGEEEKSKEFIKKLALHSVLCNDGYLSLKDGHWSATGDAVDVALIVFGEKVGVSQTSLEDHYKRLAEIPYESSIQYQGTFHQGDGEGLISIKGAVEKVMEMCSFMETKEGIISLDKNRVTSLSNKMGKEGFRVLAIAYGSANVSESSAFKNANLKGLTFLGLVGMIDPLRRESKEAITACRNAGITVAMVTGDHPSTSFYIGRELGLVDNEEQVVTGAVLKNVDSEEEYDVMVNRAHVFSRVEPTQKLEIVNSLKRNGNFVAVTGDGANDSPALKSAHVGISMGKMGTDVARESSDLILTDDNFASIVAGIEEGRVAYSNIRKVVYLLISTGAAEVLIFLFSTLLGLPIPLTAVQVLWMNFVTEGVQALGMAFEKAEGDELYRPPRRTSEPIFNRLMIKRVIITALFMSVLSVVVFKYYLSQGKSLFEARNAILLLMVLFENVMIGNCRSETKSTFRISPFKNLFLLFGSLGAQLLHILAMNIPFLANILKVKPISFKEWGVLFLLSTSVIVVVEIDKFLSATFSRNRSKLGLS